MDDTGVLLVVGALVLGAVVGFLLSPKPVVMPYVDAGADIQLSECCSTRLTCEAFDPSGGSVTYHWTAKDGKGSFDDPSLLHPTYTAPPISGCSEDIVLTLTVTNEHSVKASDSMTVQVRDAIGHLPLERCRPMTFAPRRVSPVVPACPAVPVPHFTSKPAQACAPLAAYCAPVSRCCPPNPQCMDESSPQSVNEGESVVLHGTVYDPDNNVTGYRWTATAGTFDGLTSLNPVYTAPMVNNCNGEDVCITLTAIDSCCAKGNDQIILYVNNVNHPPVVDAGEDVSVDPCGSVQLTCSASDPDGDALSYHWTVTGGRGGLSNPYLLHPVFTAPSAECCAGEDVTLTLTVTDACGASASDSMVVHVNPQGEDCASN